VSSKLDEYLDNAGWTGSKLYTAEGGIRLGTGSSTGSLVSPALDLSADNKVSVRIKAKAFNNDTNCQLKISCGDSTAIIVLPDSIEAEYTQVLDCTSADQNVTFETTARSKRVIITEVEIYSGDINKETALKAFGEMLFPNLTELSYTVTDLLPATVYLYDVQAVIDGKQSKWSNKIEVLTLSGLAGDVNGDGNVNASDVTALYNFLLTGNDESIVNGDQNGDGFINASDVTAVYNIILGE